MIALSVNLRSADLGTLITLIMPEEAHHLYQITSHPHSKGLLKVCKQGQIHGDNSEFWGPSIGLRAWDLVGKFGSELHLQFEPHPYQVTMSKPASSSKN